MYPAQLPKGDIMNRKKLIGVVAACIIGVVVVALIVFASGQGAPGDRVVTFQDRNLGTAIREALNKPSGPIHASDLAALTSLTASDSGIEHLSGLQYCTNLTYLDVWHNLISDVYPLANLTNLIYLDAGDDGVGDIYPLANLTSLTYLYLYSNQIGDISPLANLTDLSGLSLQYNQINDISPLANLTSLTDLDLGHNQISDISPLANLTGLTSLYLQQNQISDISVLANLTSLTEILLYSNQISDISPLVDNPALGQGDYVSLKNNPLSSDSLDTYLFELRVRGVTVDY